MKCREMLRIGEIIFDFVFIIMVYIILLYYEKIRGFDMKLGN